jgi:hypothetical protein
VPWRWRMPAAKRLGAARVCVLRVPAFSHNYQFCNRAGAVTAPGGRHPGFWRPVSGLSLAVAVTLLRKFCHILPVKGEFRPWRDPADGDS